MKNPEILERAGEWYAADVADESLWTETLSGAELEEIDSALRSALAKSHDVMNISKQDLSLIHIPSPETSLHLVCRLLLEKKNAPLTCYST